MIGLNLDQYEIFRFFLDLLIFIGISSKTSIISILRTIYIDLTTTNSVSVGEYNIIDRVDDNKVDKAKIGTKAAKLKNQDKSKVKNLIKFFMAKFQASRFETGFFISKAR